MVQVKKEAVRESILESGRKLFKAEGYARATMNAIAREAGVAPATLYVYYRSKLEVFFAIYDPWLRAKLETLQEESRCIKQPQKRLEFLLMGLWRDVPFADNSFTNNLMQAVSTKGADEHYDTTLLEWSKAQIAAVVADCLPPKRRQALNLERITHLLFMAFDGFSLNAHFAPDRPCDVAMVRIVAELLIGPTTRKAV
ncbi:MAG: TetR/AcrR family transcriptional regulator [Bradyrhizobium sp.]